MSKILSIGADTQLLRSRGLILQRACTDVQSAAVESALKQLETDYFEVLVLCHTLASWDVIRICKMAELFWPISRLLLMEEAEGAPLPAANLDAAFPWKLGPTAFLALTGELMREAQLHHGRQTLLISSHVPARQGPQTERYASLDLPRYPPQSRPAAERSRSSHPLQRSHV